MATSPAMRRSKLLGSSRFKMESDDRPIVRVTDNDLQAAMQILACIARPHNQSKLEAGGNLLQAWFWARKRQRGESTPDLDFQHGKAFQRSRIEPKLNTFSKDLWNAFVAGRWLQSKLLSDASNLHPWFEGFSGLSLRYQAANHWNRKNANRIALDNSHTTSRDDDAGNIRASIWRKRRPIVHMALAAANEICRAASNRDQPSDRLEELVAKRQAISPQCDRDIAEKKGETPAIAEWNRLSKAISEKRKNSRQPLELEAIVFDPVWVSPALEQAEKWASTIERRNITNGQPLWRFVR